MNHTSRRSMILLAHAARLLAVCDAASLEALRQRYQKARDRMVQRDGRWQVAQ
jgi:uncharacterized protein YqiB (DUF1249 family)